MGEHLGAKAIEGDNNNKNAKKQAPSTTNKPSPEDEFETLLLDTWDVGNKADVATFVSSITAKNCNNRTKENGWTPLMILAGLDADGTVNAIEKVIEMGGNPAITDNEGWNALHWSAFHGSKTAAAELMKHDPSLLDAPDREGKNAFDTAKAEGNKDVAKFFDEWISSSSSSDDGANNTATTAASSTATAETKND